jgi:N-acetylglutamate synthase-like GNAT family acetyltransferase
METHTSTNHTLRPATAADAEIIHQIISNEHLNPMSLNWERFVLAQDDAGNVIGCGQIKPHGDGTFELASIAVVPEWRGRGVARRIIEHLLEQHPGRLYLTCRDVLEPLYQKFGFVTVGRDEMTPYFLRLSRLANLFTSLLRRSERMLVMRRG